MPPLNDNFADATDLGAATSSSLAGQTTLAATSETDEPNAGGFGRTVWYKWTCPADVTAVLFTTTIGSHALVLYAAGPDFASLGYIDSNTNRAAATHRSFPSLTPGDDYYLQVDALGASSGDAFTLTWQTWTVPANDNFADATDLGETTTGARTTDFLFGATSEADETNVGSSQTSIWFKWTCPPDDGLGVSVNFNTAGSTDLSNSRLDTYLAVFTGTALLNLVEIGADDDSGPGVTSSLTFDAIPSTVYWIQITGYGGAEGRVSLNWTATIAQAPPPNDNFADAIDLGTTSSGSRTADSNVGATFEDSENHQAGSGANTIWYRWTAPANSTTASFDTNGSVDGSNDPLDTVIAIYTGTSLDDLETVNYDDDGGDSPNSLVTFDVTPGTVYYIQVGGYNDDDVGTIHLHWVSDGSGPPPPPPPTPSTGGVLRQSSRLVLSKQVVTVRAGAGEVTTDSRGSAGWTYGAIDTALIRPHGAAETQTPIPEFLTHSSDGKFVGASRLNRGTFFPVQSFRRVYLFRVEGREVTLLDVKGADGIDTVIDDINADLFISVAAKAESDLHAVYTTRSDGGASGVGVAWRPFSVANDAIEWMSNTVFAALPDITTGVGTFNNPSITGLAVALLWLDTDTVAVFSAPTQWGWTVGGGGVVPVRLPGLEIYSWIYDVAGGASSLVSFSSATIRSDTSRPLDLLALWRGGKEVTLIGKSVADTGGPQGPTDVWTCEWNNGSFGAISRHELDLVNFTEHNNTAYWRGTLNHGSERGAVGRTDVYTEFDANVKERLASGKINRKWYGPHSESTHAVVVDNGDETARVPAMYWSISSDPNNSYLLANPLYNDQHTLAVSDLRRILYVFGAFRDSAGYSAGDKIAVLLSSSARATLMLAPVSISSAVNPPVVHELGFVGAEETVTVPAGYNILSIDAHGPPSNLTVGSEITARFDVVEGDVIQVKVGGIGEPPNGSSGGAGGYNGGGDGGDAPSAFHGGYGGSGLTEVRLNGDLILVAGGPGGQASGFPGGPPGGAVDSSGRAGSGSQGVRAEDGRAGVAGASNTDPGTGGAGGDATTVGGPNGGDGSDGAFFQGGRGGEAPGTNRDGGGGGGGGYEGGGGGGASANTGAGGAGSGGTSWVHESGTTVVMGSGGTAPGSVSLEFSIDADRKGVVLLGDAQPEPGFHAPSKLGENTIRVRRREKRS